ncbi:MAG: hypothetical protein GY805_15405 [Chloroflexi bacterium]|nr:hypothetical protein [Chloroflexota bacterium]
MATDSHCWHCGKSLPKRRIVPPKQPQLLTAVPNDNPPAPSLNIILLYVGLTAVTLLILIVTTSAISHAPLFQVSGSSTVREGWQPINDSRLKFSLNLPETWQIIEMDDSDEAHNLQDSLPLLSVSQTFDSLVADADLILVGAEDTAVFSNGTPVFVLIAQSKRLQQLSSAEIITYAQTQLPDNVAVVEAYTSKDERGGVRGNLLLDIEKEGKIWNCLQQFVPDSSGIYLVAACTDFNQFPTYLADFKLILSSFQPLRS